MTGRTNQAGNPIEVRTKRTLRRVLHRLHQAAQEADDAREQSQEWQERQTAASELRSRMTLPGSSHTATFIILVASIVSIYFIDYLLFGSIAEYFAKKTFYEGHWAVKLAPYLGPLLVILIELMIATQIYLAGERAADLEGSVWAHRGWILIGAILALVMPSAAVAMNLGVSEGRSFFQSTAVSQVLQVTTIALAFVSHIAILFGGRIAQEAKDWSLVVIRYYYSRRARAKWHSRATRYMDRVVDMFSLYREKVVTALGVGILVLPGSIETKARKILEERFGRDIVEELDEGLKRSPVVKEGLNPLLPMESPSPADGTRDGSLAPVSDIRKVARVRGEGSEPIEGEEKVPDV